MYSKLQIGILSSTARKQKNKPKKKRKERYKEKERKLHEKCIPNPDAKWGRYFGFETHEFEFASFKIISECGWKKG